MTSTDKCNTRYGSRIFYFQLAFNNTDHYTFKEAVYDDSMPGVVYEREQYGDAWTVVPFKESPLNVFKEECLRNTLCSLHLMLYMKKISLGMPCEWTVLEEKGLLKQYYDLVIGEEKSNASFGVIRLFPSFYKDEKIKRNQT